MITNNEQMVKFDGMYATVDGLSFQIGPIGVCVSWNYDLDNPQVIAALKQVQAARETLSELKLLHDIRHYATCDWVHPNEPIEDVTGRIIDYYRTTWTGYARRALSNDIATCDRLLAQTVVETPDWLPEFKTWLRASRVLKPPKDDAPVTCPAPAKPGYLYLIRSSNTDLYKIGKAKDPHDRARIFGVKLPFEVEFLHTIKCKDYTAAERVLHDRYATKRTNGEWFALTDEDVTAIKSIKRM